MSCYTFSLQRFSIFVYSGQEQQDRNYAASIQYQCGDKCFVSVVRQTNKQTSKIVAPFELDFFKMAGCNKVKIVHGGCMCDLSTQLLMWSSESLFMQKKNGGLGIIYLFKDLYSAVLEQKQ